ncbi:MAG: hypothetical protein HQL78_03630 [Magnetococcales bacterium]|nr:hypothetical protein [Magnetococcales bacterium]
MSLTPLQTHYVRWHSLRLSQVLQRFQRSHPEPDRTILGFLFAHHWLKREVHPVYRHQVAKILDHPHLLHPMASTLLLQTENRDDVHFINHILEKLETITHHKPSSRDVLTRWQDLRLFASPYKESVRRIGRQEKAILNDLGGENDQQRVALVDSLAKDHPPPPPWDKIALIVRMSCPQSCRHCLFIWRPSLKNTPDPEPLLQWINQSTTNLLFTGGDLSPDLDLFYHAIATLEHITTFAILLNADLARSREAAESLFARANHALQQRPARVAKARVVLQISFDEYHQEILANHRGELKERIPVSHIAHILIASARYSDCQVALIHKQHSLNFSTRLFETGIFARLRAELATHAWHIRDIHWQTSPRFKEHPVNPLQNGGVIREAHVLLRGPSDSTSFFFMSSCIDALGRAQLLDPAEYVRETLLLRDWLDWSSPIPECDPFDTDPMVWVNGHVTLFGAITLWMGNFYREGERVFARFRQDPLIRALQQWDRRLLTAHQAFNPHGHQQLVKTASSPHHLLQTMFQDSKARLFVTQWLIRHDTETSSTS